MPKVVKNKGFSKELGFTSSYALNRDSAYYLGLPWCDPCPSGSRAPCGLGQGLTNEEVLTQSCKTSLKCLKCF